MATVESETVQVFQGVRYYRCGPYFQRKGKRLHRAAWESLNGPVPKGHHVHHKDHDRANNQPENLECVPRAAHLSHHSSSPEAKEIARRSLAANARPAAAAWHSSPEGLEFHRQLGAMTASRLVERTVTCTVCGSEFTTNAAHDNVLYCRSKCRDKARRLAAGILPLTPEQKVEAARKAWDTRRSKKSST